MRKRRLASFVFGTFLLVIGTAPVNAATGPPIFIDEFHYDNVGADAGEFVEVFGPAGTNLTGWSIVLYNGSSGNVYGTQNLSGTIPDAFASFGVIVTNYPASGIQNGAPDGIALVDDTFTVVQFLSYEGTFTATDGPASGLTSTDIGVFEAGAESPGLSLQLTGNLDGDPAYSDFTWTGPILNTAGALNFGQVPEPSSICLSGVAAAGLFLAWLRRSRHCKA